MIESGPTLQRALARSRSAQLTFAITGRESHRKGSRGAQYVAATMETQTPLMALRQRGERDARSEEDRALQEGGFAVPSRLHSHTLADQTHEATLP